jgi:SAM-dependent methyltransferase
VAFETLMVQRSVADYADFLVPYLDLDAQVLDVGCGEGSLTVGLAPMVRHVTGVDAEADFADATAYAAAQGIDNVEFRRGDAYTLDFPDAGFDACLCHSVLEALDRPADALREMRRTLRPGGVLAAACVEYGGLVLAGPGYDLIRRFYQIRERLWLLTDSADPYRGRALRGLMNAAGFVDVVASSTYRCYGTEETVRSFGSGRAADCHDDWYAGMAVHHGLATPDDLDAMERAWLEWSHAPDAYAAFAWCRVVGRRPIDGS